MGPGRFRHKSQPAGGDIIRQSDTILGISGQMAGVTEELVPVYPMEDQISFLRRLADTLLKDLNISGTIPDNFRYIFN